MFGTDGIRGKINQGYFTYPNLPRLGLAIGKAFQDIEPKRILIGKDTRISGDMIETFLASSLISQGWEVVSVGILPTPGVAKIMQDFQASLGVMISASHNPPEDNGIKIFQKGGEKLAEEREKAMEKAYLDSPEEILPWKDLGRWVDGKRKALERYIEILCSSFSHLNLENMVIALDCAHGATYQVAPQVFHKLGAQVVSLGVSPNGKNINQKVGALYPESLQHFMGAVKGDIGFCYDGDGDRVICVNEKGEILDGDFILAVLADHYDQQNQLLPRKIVATSMSNLGLEQYLQNKGIQLVRTQVGDKYVFEAMKAEDIQLGGEQSGHIIIQHYGFTGDGITTSLALLEAMLTQKKKMSQLALGFRKYPQLIHNIKVPCKPPFAEIPGLEKKIQEVEAQLKGRGRLVLRYSGTEDLLRIMLEGQEEEEIDQIKNLLAETIEKGFQIWQSSQHNQR